MIVTLFLPNSSHSEECVSVLNQNDLKDFKINNTEKFEGNYLFDYLDGGADLYFEYGFDYLIVQEISIADTKYSIEYYIMNSPESAFGIFSVIRDTVERVQFKKNIRTSQTSFQFLMCFGNKFIRIINPNGTNEGKVICSNLAEQIYEKCQTTDYKLPFSINPIFDSLKLKAKLILGKLGIQNGSPNEPDYFSTLDKMGLEDSIKKDEFKFFFIPFDDENGTSISILKFKNDKIMTEFYNLTFSRNEKVFKDGKELYSNVLFDPQTLSITLFKSYDKKMIDELENFYKWK